MIVMKKVDEKSKIVSEKKNFTLDKFNTQVKVVVESEIKSILSISSKSILSSVEHMNNLLTCSGRVFLNVIYVDGEGVIKSAETSVDFIEKQQVLMNISDVFGYDKTTVKIDTFSGTEMLCSVTHNTQIYGIYLKYVAPEDIHVYSIDEVFIDATPYLRTYRLTAEEFARKLISDVLDETGITATAGIGTNLYLCKIAMDIMAKKMKPDKNGVRIARLDEISYRRELWDHRPLTDFWRIGRGYERRLNQHGMFTMGDVARCSLTGEDVLYKLFGVNAELLIDHAWGWENCTMADIKAYRPAANSVGMGQVLHEPYTWEKARLIVREMVDLLVLDLVDKGLTTDQIVLTVGYDRMNLEDPQIRQNYTGEVVMDHYGRLVPKHGHGTANLGCFTASTKVITEAMVALFDRITDPNLLVRRVNIVACRVKWAEENVPMQLDLFTDPRETAWLEKEKRRQRAVLHIRK